MLPIQNLSCSHNMHMVEKKYYLLCHWTVLRSRCAAVCSPLTWHECVVRAASVCGDSCH